VSSDPLIRQFVLTWEDGGRTSSLNKRDCGKTS